jgi:hypothetical protein
MKTSPFYCVTPNHMHDISKLFPAVNGKGGFETLEQIPHRIDIHLKLTKTQPPKIQKRLEAAIKKCVSGGEPCEKVICSKCSRQYRVWFFSRAYRLFLEKLGFKFIATVFLEDVPQGELHLTDLAKIKLRVRKRLQRLALGFLRIIGGIEIAWDNGNQSWRIHAHLLVIVQNEIEIPRIRAALENTKISKSVRIDEIRNPIRQISYLQKFGMIHYPKPRTGERRSRSFPLPLEQGSELCSFFLKHKFENFLFLFGLRRRGKNIVPS